MAWYHYLWPFGRKKRELNRQIEDEFKAELEKAYERHGDLDDIVQQLRDRKPERASKPPEPALQGNGS